MDVEMNFTCLNIYENIHELQIDLIWLRQWCNKTNGGLQEIFIWGPSSPPLV